MLFLFVSLRYTSISDTPPSPIMKAYSVLCLSYLGLFWNLAPVCSNKVAWASEFFPQSQKKGVAGARYLWPDNSLQQLRAFFVSSTFSTLLFCCCFTFALPDSRQSLTGWAGWAERSKQDCELPLTSMSMLICAPQCVSVLFAPEQKHHDLHCSVPGFLALPPLLQSSTGDEQTGVP